ncbi:MULTISPECIES: hypothetical protein [Corynebacterium]|uniref:hypothetical protein n=1 Tax=Corynebacterium TaxID=1716 RepID=UPI00195E36CA|nr:MULTISPECIES: hypothetical protein [Corynebacterium]MDN8624896.1 hypothetical protein [Corynebacterium kroppenstedtii]QRQ65507.1 hypothetical protein I6J23_03450 [Corynebacterium kroppenstedtii]
MSSATKRILSVGVAGILMIIVAFVVGAIIGADNATTASSALLDMLFVGGVGAIFGAIFVGIFKKTSTHVKSVLGIVGLVVALFCQSVMDQQQDSPEIFSPALLVYPALGLVIMCVIHPLIETRNDH